MLLGFKEYVDKNLGIMQGVSPKQLDEVLIVLGKRAYPRSGHVVILAGGAGSGKGFTISNLLGIEGRVLDVDRLKELTLKSKKLKELIKAKTGHDVDKMNLKNPEDTSTLHELIGDEFNWANKREQVFFESIAASNPENKPNIIFDVTLSTLEKLRKITASITELGYVKENIHLVWVVDDFQMSLEKNRKRERTVFDEILLGTHEGAALTMRKVVDMGEDIEKYLNGDIVLSFNKMKVDSALIARSQKNEFTRKELEWIAKDKKGQYVERSNYVRIKKAGQRINETRLNRDVLEKIASYVPKTKIWEVPEDE